MRIDSPIMTNAVVTGSFSGSFVGTFEGDIQADSVEYANVLNKPALVSGSDQIILSDTVGYSTFSSSIASNIAFNASEISALQSFSSSLGGDYATDAELASVSGALEAHINSVESVSTANASKLAGIEAGATADQTASEILTAIKTVDGAGSGLDADLLDGQSSAYYATATALANASSSLASSITSEKGRIDAILDASSADKDSFAEIVTLINSVDLANDQAFAAYYTSSNGRLDALELESGSIDGRVSSLESTVSSLDSTYATDSQLSVVSGALESHINAVETVSDANASKLAGIESGATADQTAAEIKTAYESNANTNAFTDALLSKVNAIEAGATADQTAAEILTAIKTVDGAGSGLDADLLDGQSSAYYATATAVSANTTKLAGIEAGATADQTASEILIAIKTVDGTGSGLDADLLDGQQGTYYATSASVAANTTKLDGIEAGATADQSAAEIKIAYESNANTNAFTDALLSKVNAIEAGATADQTASEILTAIKTVDGAGSGLDADLLDGQQGSYYATATSVSANTSKLAGIEAGATADQTAAEIKIAYESNADTNAYTDAAVAKLAGIEAGAEVNTVDSVAGKTGTVILVKGDVGLANVDNTSDAAKPVSTTQQTALNFKANLASPALTGTPTAPTPADNDNSTKIATTAFVMKEVSDLIGGAGAAFDTLLEISASIANGDSDVVALTVAVGGKLQKDQNLFDLPSAPAARANLGLGSLATLSSVNAATITDNSVGAAELNVTGNGTTAQFLRSDGDGTFTWATPTDTNTTYSAGNGITLTGTSYSVAAGVGLSQDTGGLSHSDTSTQGSITNTGRTYIQSLTLDTFGHVTSATSATETVVDTDTTYSVGNGGLTEINFTSALNTKLTGIATSANNYSLPEATSTVRGGIELFSDTDQSVAANAVSTTASRTYGIQLNSVGQAVVNVPWVDTDTTYTRASFINQDVNTTNNVHFEGLMIGQTTGATANTIRCIGDVVAYYSSDAQFKDNVQTLEGALDKVKAIRGVRFDWNDKQDVYEGHDIGVIAQEVEVVLPELVHYREHSDSKAVDYVKLTAVLIEAVKELSAKVEKLENKL